MARTGSLPYVFLLAAVTLGVGTLLWVVLDAAVAEVITTQTWGNGSEHATRGRDHALAMWDWALVMVVTSTSISVLVASRRGR
jgi:hypothetical protein